MSLTVGPACQVFLPLDKRRRSPVISPRRRGLRPNRGHQRDPQTLANRLTPFSPWRSHRKGLVVDHGGSAEMLDDTPELSGR